MTKFVATDYDIETGAEIGRHNFEFSDAEVKGLFSEKERATLARGEFVEILDERIGIETRYAVADVSTRI
jgi:hypothetical protein